MKLLYLLTLIPLLCACSGKVTKSESIASPPSSPVILSRADSKIASPIPKATAFRIAPEYDGKVAVTLNAEGNLTYFPDPSDITHATIPLSLGNGWWLNRQGISAASVFTTYSYDEYAALPSVPSQQQLKDAVIPGSGVEQFVTLPFTSSEALSNIPRIKELLGIK